MTVVDLTDPVARAEAIRLGYVWSGPRGAQSAAIEDIVSGRVPMPAYLPDEVRNTIASRTGKPVDLGVSPEGQGPV